MNTQRNGEPVFTISELAEAFGTTKRSIRFYEEKGLISPGRTAGNHRIYTRRDRIRLKLILRGRRFGYTLEEIGEMIGMTDIDMREIDQIQKSLEYGEKKLRDISHRIQELKQLQRDMLQVKEKLLKRLSELKAAD